MAVPVLVQADILIAAPQTAVTDAELLELRDDLSRLAVTRRCSGAVIDVGGLDVIDSFACRMLLTIVHTLSLHGVRAVLVGVRPDAAMAIVQLGLDLEGVDTALDLDDGIELLSLVGAGQGERSDGR